MQGPPQVLQVFHSVPQFLLHDLPSQGPSKSAPYSHEASDSDLEAITGSPNLTDLLRFCLHHRQGVDITQLATLDTKLVAVWLLSTKSKKNIHSPEHFVNHVASVCHLQPARNANIAAWLNITAALKSGAWTSPRNFDTLVVEQVEIRIACGLDCRPCVTLPFCDVGPAVTSQLSPMTYTTAVLWAPTKPLAENTSAFQQH